MLMTDTDLPLLKCLYHEDYNYLSFFVRKFWELRDKERAKFMFPCIYKPNILKICAIFVSIFKTDWKLYKKNTAKFIFPCIRQSYKLCRKTQKNAY